MALNEKQSDGNTLRSHLESVYRSTRRKPEQLIQPDIPNKVKHLLRLYGDLSQGRQSGFSANPISSLEIQAWLQLTDRTLSNWEIQTLRAMDRAYLS